MIDWQLVILLLNKYGKKTSVIAKDCCMSYPHVKRLRQGVISEPKFNSGVKLLDYAYEVVPKDDFFKVKI